MYLSHIIIENFRQFGRDEQALHLTFNEGLTAIVGENDSGKSTLIDAIRYALQTRDQEFIRVQPDDFHMEADGKQATEISIRCKLSNLSNAEKGAFAEYLTYEGADVNLYIKWGARRLEETQGSRRWVDVSVHSGADGTGPQLESAARALLWATYLRPLRDAEKELSPGGRSRLSQILENYPAITDGGKFDPDTPPSSLEEIDSLGLVGLSDFFRNRLSKHPGIFAAQNSINEQYLKDIALDSDRLYGKVSVAESGSEKVRLRQVLERLELGLLEGPGGIPKGHYGLGSNNLLFMACELLLLGKEQEGLPLLLIEEPEVHLHPQRQLRLTQFLEQAAKGNIEGERAVQVILTTHSPNLASSIRLDNMVLLQGSRGYSLAAGKTRLERSDYRFLERFLDVTKANLFFARGLIIVEGDAEALLIPTLADLIGKNLTKKGISIVNVGGVGLSRYSRILQRHNDKEPPVGVPVACLTDLDVMPDCAPEILDLVSGDDDPGWKKTKKKWKARKELGTTLSEQQAALENRRKKLSDNDAQNVQTFVSNQWTLEYDLAYAGLAEEVYIAACLAKNDDPLNEDKKNRDDVEKAAATEYAQILADSGTDREKLCSKIYRLFKCEGASKAIAAQYLAEILSRKVSEGSLSPDALKARLPTYLIDAIDYVTSGLTVSHPVSDVALSHV
ncbi:MAG: ATP-dependent endonuclease [Anaerolineaceae bacterium]|nr:ATP-dependent endonuclease [Anaerolineaceae bacterium]